MSKGESFAEFDLIFHTAETRSLDQLIAMRDLHFNILNLPGYVGRIVGRLQKTGNPKSEEEIIRISKQGLFVAQQAINLLISDKGLPN